MSTPSAEHPFSGQQVSLVGRLTLFSKRDARALVERLGGVFSTNLTPRSTIIVTGAELPLDVPPGVHRVLSEGDLCREAGLPDLETLRSRYYSARDLRGMYPTLRDDHLRYLEKWGLVRQVAGRYSFADLHIVKQAAGEVERGASLNAVLRAVSSEQEGPLAFDFQLILVNLLILASRLIISPLQLVADQSARAQTQQSTDRRAGARMTNSRTDKSTRGGATQSADTGAFFSRGQ